MYAFKCMLPDFHRYGHYKYGKWGAIFVDEMSHLPEVSTSEYNYFLRHNVNAFLFLTALCFFHH